MKSIQSTLSKFGEDKDSEVFEKFFHNLAIKISDFFFKNKIVTSKISDKKYRNEVDIDTNLIINSLIKTTPKMVKILTDNLNINDKNSLQVILISHFKSAEFRRKIEGVSKPYYTTGEVPQEKILIEMNNFLKYSLKSRALKNKILNLKSYDNFLDWLISKKDAVLCGFSLVIFLLSFTFYVFID